MNQNNFFNIYPSPGDGPHVIYIQGVDRKTDCIDRSFLQWTEENCAKSNNLYGVADAADLYISDEPSLAKLNLVSDI